MYLIKNILGKIFIYTNSHFFFHLFTSKIVSCSFHKYDKLGRPCYIEHTGRTDTTALMKVCSKHLKSGSIFVLYLSRKMYFLKRSFGFFFKISKQIQIKTCLSFYMQLPQDQFIGWHIWNNERQIQRMRELSTKLVSNLTPLSPTSDQDRISPYTVSTISSGQVMRIKKNINQGIIS